MNFLARLWHELPHMLDRAQLHYFYAIGLTIFAFFALRSLRRIMMRRKSKFAAWMPNTHGTALVYADFLICLLAFSREAWDVAHGQWVFKAYTDYASWILGVVTGDLLTYRLIWLDWRDQ